MTDFDPNATRYSAELKFGPTTDLQPALDARDSSGVDAILRADLVDGFGEIVSHGALRELEAGGGLGARLTVSGPAQDLPLAIGQRVGLRPRFRGQLGIDRASAAVH